LALKGVDDIERCYRLALGVFGVCDRVTDHVLEEDLRKRYIPVSISNPICARQIVAHLENTTSLLVDEARDTLDTTTASKTADGRLSDALDVVAQLSVPS
jgi:hypothetical protein